ncbi:MAG: hypothetical protein SGI74_09830 [Oligoflexia bacterium]|nr:hypothetical protein [Oligoflexia bacterium]
MSFKKLRTHVVLSLMLVVLGVSTTLSSTAAANCVVEKWYCGYIMDGAQTAQYDRAWGEFVSGNEGWGLRGEWQYNPRTCERAAQIWVNKEGGCHTLVRNTNCTPAEGPYLENMICAQ